MLVVGIGRDAGATTLFADGGQQFAFHAFRDDFRVFNLLGVFVELEPGLEGLLHISELADQKIESPEEVVKVGDEIEVKILRVDAADRKIGLSRKQLNWTPEQIAEAAAAEEAAAATAAAKPQRELRGGTGTASGQLITMPDADAPVA